MARTAKTFHKGDKVNWASHGGTAHGAVERIATRRTEIKGHVVAASKDDPEVIVRSDKGGRAAHKPSVLRRDD